MNTEIEAPYTPPKIPDKPRTIDRPSKIKPEFSSNENTMLNILIKPNKKPETNCCLTG
jgi:hypothetical protein